MRASAAIDHHQGAFWGGHLNAGGVATITKCVSPGSGKRAPGSPELDLHTRRINAHSACSHLPSPATTDVGVRTDSTFLLSSSFVHPVRRAPARECRNQPQVLHETNRHERPGEIMIVRPGSAISSNPTRFGEWSEWDERSGSCRTTREAVSKCGQRANFNWTRAA